MVSDKNVSVNGNKKFTFSVYNGNAISVKVEPYVEFTVDLSQQIFQSLLGYVTTLKNLQLVDDKFKFKVEANHEKSALTFGGMNNIKGGFLITEDAWKSIKNFNYLFDFGDGISVSKKNNDQYGLGSQHGRIGKLYLNFNIFDNQGKVLKEWDKIFIKYVKPNMPNSSKKKSGQK